jgi:hypothetical protein
MGLVCPHMSCEFMCLNYKFYICQIPLESPPYIVNLRKKLGKSVSEYF